MVHIVMFGYIISHVLSYFLHFNSILFVISIDTISLSTRLDAIQYSPLLFLPILSGPDTIPYDASLLEPLNNSYNGTNR